MYPIPIEAVSRAESIKKPEEGKDITSSIHQVKLALLKLDDYGAPSAVTTMQLFEHLQPSLNKIRTVIDSPLKTMHKMDLRSYLKDL